ncbi:hypothetical protein [Streptomyces sp. NPDC047981]|uniref:hypothetical protein n=1 Tax=Streptomyces sp. NPDC047981 TaxID=3154610 RepID=UPI003439967D
MRRGPMSEDPQFTTVSMPDDYARQTDTAVVYAPVVRGGVTVGHVWASATEAAAGFLASPAAGTASRPAAIVWTRRLRESKAQGLTALEALRRWTGQADDPKAGHVPADAEGHAPNLAALEADKG